jgi:hypothetical protein
MSASPAPTLATSPVPLAVATDALDEAHAAWVVTGIVAPVERIAVAVNWAVAPTRPAVPVTVTDETVGVVAVVVVVVVVGVVDGVVDAPPQAAVVEISSRRKWTRDRVDSYTPACGAISPT